MRTLRTFIDQRLQPPYLFLVSGAVLVVGIALAIVAFVTSDKGRTAVGIPFGADFAGFYVAAQILDRGEPEQLYNRALHAQLYHELLPNVSEKEVIPYVHPPFVAGVLRLLSWLPYEYATVLWLIISAALYSAGVVVLLKAPPPLEERRGVSPPVEYFPSALMGEGKGVGGSGHKFPLPHPAPTRGEGESCHRRAHAAPLRDFWLILLLSLSFEPFLFECWLGGQLSAVGFFSYALAYYLLQRGKPVFAGMALGLCFYKPTLLVLALPLLLLARRWYVLIGVMAMGLVLALLSILLTGWQVSVDYVNVLLSFQQSTSQGELAIRTWKYVDLHHVLQQLLGQNEPGEKVAFVILFIVPFIWLAWNWMQWKQMRPRQQQLLWASLLTWTPVLNVYVGIYDSILVVQGALLAADLMPPGPPATSAEGGRHKSSTLAYLLVALYLTPWFSQMLAKTTGFPLYTLVLIGLALFYMARLRKFAHQTRRHLVFDL